MEIELQKLYDNGKDMTVYVENVAMLTPFGNTQETWDGICSGKAAYGKITRFDTDESRYVRSKVAGEVNFNADAHSILTEIDKDRMPKYMQWAVALADELINERELPPGRTAVLVSPGLSIFIDSVEAHKENRVNSYTFCSNLVAQNINIKYGFTGPSAMTMTACSTGMYSIILGCMLLETGQADYVIAGAVDRSVSLDSVIQMGKLRALSTKYNDTPKLASRPWDNERDGLVMSEGGGLMLLTNKDTGNALCTVDKYAMNNDAHQVVAPHPEGKLIEECMRSALDCEPDLINAHATSTPMGDYIEIDAIERLGLGHVPITANKSQLGHSMGASGAVEACLSVLSIARDTITPSINVDNIKEGYNINYTSTALSHPINTVLCNSFGFGGTNACILFKSLK